MAAAIPYMIRRVQECYDFFQLPEIEKIHSDQKKEFLSHLAKDQEDRQVKQADTAIRFHQFYLSKQNSAPSRNCWGTETFKPA